MAEEQCSTPDHHDTSEVDLSVRFGSSRSAQCGGEKIQHVVLFYTFSFIPMMLWTINDSGHIVTSTGHQVVDHMITVDEI